MLRCSTLQINEYTKRLPILKLLDLSFILARNHVNVQIFNDTAMMDPLNQKSSKCFEKIMALN
jgi:hypothetical protein